ncbi:MAG TPA: hypothetical protein VGQ57_02815 [Polyangiaceae bacterium]|jgi:hypothetical protein|nr:hypothetical protein [Polyangiaceae bacterium]
MTFSTSALFGVLTLVGFSAACSSAQARPESAARAAVECDGGDVRTEREADRYYACERIVGDLRIEGTALRELNAFANVRSVSGALTIAHNASLETLGALARLRSVRKLTIAGNPELTDLRGLGGLERVERLELRRNGFYRTLGLEHLRSVGELVVKENPNLVSLSGLNHVAVAGSLQISDNPRLSARLGLLPALESLRGELVVSHNLGVSKADVEALSERAKAAGIVARNDH